MKQLILSFLIFCCHVLLPAQDNPERAAQLLKIPTNFAKYNGQVQKKITYEIVEYRVTDNTNIDTIGGKLVRVVEVKSTFKVEPKIEDFGTYGLNLISMYINNYGHSVTSDSTLYRPSFTATSTVGQFAGYTYLHGWETVLLSKASGGYNFNLTYYPYMNTETNGLPAITPWITIKLVNITRSGNVSISQKRFKATITNVSETKMRPTFIRYTKEQIENLSGWTEDQVAEGKKTVYQIFSTPGSTHINSLACDIEPNGNKLKGVPYINGIRSSDISYTTKRASMGLNFPQFVQRWRLYNGGVIKEAIFGSTWLQQLSANEINEITLVPGSVFNWNETSRTLTYDETKPTTLWYQFECLPAQGKNEGWQYIMDPKTGLQLYN